MKNDKVSDSVLYCCIKNMTVVVIFGILAYYFDKWWIILFSILLQSSFHSDDSHQSKQTSRNSNIIRCDVCGEMLFVHDLQSVVHKEFKDNGWTRINVSGKWYDLCSHCADKLSKYSNETKTTSKKE